MKTLNLSEHGKSIGPRVLGLQISRAILNDINSDSDLTSVIDFTGVRTISSGFALELFGNLKAALGDEFSKRIKIKLTGEDHVDSEIKAIIFRALQTALDERKAGN